MVLMREASGAMPDPLKSTPERQMDKPSAAERRYSADEILRLIDVLVSRRALTSADAARMTGLALLLKELDAAPATSDELVARYLEIKEFQDSLDA
jgi:hypothetical protein